MYTHTHTNYSLSRSSSRSHIFSVSHAVFASLVSQEWFSYTQLRILVSFVSGTHLASQTFSLIPSTSHTCTPITLVDPTALREQFHAQAISQTLSHLLTYSEVPYLRTVPDDLYGTFVLIQALTRCFGYSVCFAHHQPVQQ